MKERRSHREAWLIWILCRTAAPRRETDSDQADVDPRFNAVSQAATFERGAMRPWMGGWKEQFPSETGSCFRLDLALALLRENGIFEKKKGCRMTAGK